MYVCVVLYSGMTGRVFSRTDGGSPFGVKWRSRWWWWWWWLDWKEMYGADAFIFKYLTSYKELHVYILGEEGI